MRTIIQTLTRKVGLELMALSENLDFAYYKDKDDFFLLMYLNRAGILEIVPDNIKELEYALNNMIANQRDLETLGQFNDRNINYNLSMILFVEMDREDSELLHEFSKVEENYINAKKYILPYTEAVLTELQEKIGSDENIAEKLNNLAVSYSDSIQDSNEKWYELLLNLFIKIPFLNYRPVGGELTIENLSQSIASVLSAEEMKILEIISDADISSIEDIEAFARTKNLMQ